MQDAVFVILFMITNISLSKHTIVHPGELWAMGASESVVGRGRLLPDPNRKRIVTEVRSSSNLRWLCASDVPLSVLRAKNWAVGLLR